MPEIFAEPDHPRLAKMTHAEGNVTVSFAIDPNGLPAELQIVAGHPWLQAAVEEAVRNWRCPVSRSWPESSGDHSVRPELSKMKILTFDRR
jgi:TonB family protein